MRAHVLYMYLVSWAHLLQYILDFNNTNPYFLLGTNINSVSHFCHNSKIIIQNGAVKSAAFIWGLM